MPLFGYALIWLCRYLVLYFCMQIVFLVVVLWLPCRLLLAVIIFEFITCLIEHNKYASWMLLLGLWAPDHSTSACRD